MNRRIGVLIAGTLALWLVLVYPANRSAGTNAVLHSAVAAILCIVPTVGTMAWAGWSAKQSPEQQLLAVLGGTGVRMGLVLLVGLAIYRWIPGFHQAGFWLWLLVFYLATLTLEMVLLVGALSAAQDPANVHAAERPGDSPLNKS